MVNPKIETKQPVNANTDMRDALNEIDLFGFLGAVCSTAGGIFFMLFFPPVA